MLSHIVTDLHKTYITEVLEPKLGKSDSGNAKPEDKGDAPSGKTPDEQAAKRIRQAVYDIRYRARREDIAIDQAYNQYMSHTSMNAMEKSAVREKLGLGSSGGGSVKEENIPEAKRYLRVDPSKRGTGEKVYYRTYDPANPKDVSKRHKLQSRGIKTTATHYVPKGGLPYDNQAGEKFEKKYGSSTGKNTVGDRDGDGTVEPDGHEYAGVKDKAIKKAMAEKSKKKEKKETQKESFSNWREDLVEVVDKINDSKDKNQIIKEKPVDNKIIINPVINIEQNNNSAQLIEMVELNEEYINEVIDNATEYFYEQGLNEDGINILIEDIGVDEFSSWVFELSEERAAKKRKGGKTVEQIKAEIDEKERVKAALKASKKTTKVAKAKEEQKPAPKKEAPAKTKGGIGAAISSAVKHVQDRAQQDTKLLKKSWQTAREVGRGHERRVARAAGTVAGVAHGAAKVAHRLGQEAGKSETGKKIKKAIGVSEDFELWIYELVEEGYDLSGHTCQEMWEIYSEEFETEALDTWSPEGTSDTADKNAKIAARKQALKAKQKKVKVDPDIRNLLPPDFLKKESFELNEKLTKSTPVSSFVHDFVHSKNKKFSGKSKKERINQALGAYYSKHPEKKSVSEATVTDVPGQTSSDVTKTQKDTQKTQLQNKKNSNAVTAALRARGTSLNTQVKTNRALQTASQKGVNVTALT